MGKIVKISLRVFLYNDYDDVCDTDNDILDEEMINKFAIVVNDGMHKKIIKYINEDLDEMYKYGNCEAENDKIRILLIKEIKETVKINSDDRKNIHIIFKLKNKHLKKKLYKLNIEICDGYFSAPIDFKYKDIDYIAFWDLL